MNERTENITFSPLNTDFTVVFTLLFSDVLLNSCAVVKLASNCYLTVQRIVGSDGKSGVILGQWKNLRMGKIKFAGDQRLSDTSDSVGRWGVISITEKFGPTVGQWDQNNQAKTIGANFIKLNHLLHTLRF